LSILKIFIQIIFIQFLNFALFFFYDLLSGLILLIFFFFFLTLFLLRLIFFLFFNLWIVNLSFIFFQEFIRTVNRFHDFIWNVYKFLDIFLCYIFVQFRQHLFQWFLLTKFVLLTDPFLPIIFLLFFPFGILTLKLLLLIRYIYWIFQLLVLLLLILFGFF
jgi:hypothetical protein